MYPRRSKQLADKKTFIAEVMNTAAVTKKARCMNKKFKKQKLKSKVQMETLYAK